MHPPFFNIADLTVNFPPNYNLSKTADTPEGLSSTDVVLEEFIHHYTTLGTSQGILMTLLRIATLTLLSASTIHKTQTRNETIKIPLGPFYSHIQKYFRGSNEKPASQLTKTTRLSYDYLIAAAMNLYEYIYGYIDTTELLISA